MGLNYHLGTMQGNGGSIMICVFMWYGLGLLIHQNTLLTGNHYVVLLCCCMYLNEKRLFQQDNVQCHQLPLLPKIDLRDILEFSNKLYSHYMSPFENL